MRGLHDAVLLREIVSAQQTLQTPGGGCGLAMLAAARAWLTGVRCDVVVALEPQVPARGVEGAQTGEPETEPDTKPCTLNPKP